MRAARVADRSASTNDPALSGPVGMAALARLVPAVILALALTGCATVAGGTNETLAVDSRPSGATVELRCDSVSRDATTPAAITIPRRADDCIVTISKIGFRSQSVALERGVAPAYWLNFIGLSAITGLSDNSPLNISGDDALALIVAGGVGLAVDAIDGAMHRHEPRTIDVELAPE